MMQKLTFVCAMAMAVATTSGKQIPNVTQSFCDDNVDFQLDASGASSGTNFSYRVCMDVAKAALEDALREVLDEDAKQAASASSSAPPATRSAAKRPANPASSRSAPPAKRPAP